MLFVPDGITFYVVKGKAIWTKGTQKCTPVCSTAAVNIRWTLPKRWGCMLFQCHDPSRPPISVRMHAFSLPTGVSTASIGVLSKPLRIMSGLRTYSASWTCLCVIRQRFVNFRRLADKLSENNRIITECGPNVNCKQTIKKVTRSLKKYTFRSKLFIFSLFKK